MFTIVLALEMWRTHLFANEFPVVTDHKSLLLLMTTKDPMGYIVRWACWLQKFVFNILHIYGMKNVLPNLLSRSALDELMPDNAIPVCVVTSSFLYTVARGGKYLSYCASIRRKIRKTRNRGKLAVPPVTNGHNSGELLADYCGAKKLCYA